jgi:hypothetical protein
MEEKPEWVKKLEVEPCECIRCEMCHGTGTLYFSFGRFIGPSRHDDLDDPEPCEFCRGGIAEECGRCTMLNDYYNEILAAD